MLFRKDIERSCSYCTRSAKVDENTCLCERKGLVSANDSCRRFRYDPLKRVPKAFKPADFSEFDNVDFSL